MKYRKTYENIYRTRHINIQTFMQMLSLTHTHNEITYAKKCDNIVFPERIVHGNWTTLVPN